MLDPAGPYLPIVIGAVALTYALVGHGGASGYLALLALTTLPQREVQITALTLNVIVATIAFVMYRQAKAFSWSLSWPFLLGAAPFVLLGSNVRLSDKTYTLLVGVIVVFAGIRMLVPTRKPTDQPPVDPPHWATGTATGGVIGLLSGLVGVGGGIFLSPVAVLAKWADAKHAAATSSLFIVANSLVGLAGRAPAGLTVPAQFPWIATAAGAGALAGSWLGARKLSVDWLKKALGLMLIAAGFLTLAK